MSPHSKFFHRRYVLRGGDLFLPGRAPTRADLRIEEGTIAAIGLNLDDDVPTIDASGRWIIPGAIDAHVHFRDPGATHKEDWSSGSKAALAGGVTCVFDMPNTSPSTTTRAALDEKRRIACAASHVDFGLFFGMTEDNTLLTETLTDVVGLKIYMAPSTGNLYLEEESLLRDVFANAKRPIVVHAECGEMVRKKRSALDHPPNAHDHNVLRGPDVAYAATKQALQLAERYRKPVHVAHLSTPEEVALVSHARKRGVYATCEVALHHLLLDTGFIDEHGTLGKVNPPLRSSAQRERLFADFAAGEIEMVATDHAPHLLREKQCDYDHAAAGLPSIEWYLPLLVDLIQKGKLDAHRLSDWICGAPARIFDIADKGGILVGNDADLAIVDPLATTTITEERIVSRCGWSPFLGWELRGKVCATLVRGHCAYSVEEGFDEAFYGREIHLR